MQEIDSLGQANVVTHFALRAEGLHIGKLRLNWLLIVLSVCIAARLGVLIAFPSVFAFDQTGAVHGSEAYDTYAQNILSTGVHGRVPSVPDAAIPPGYSYALAVVYAIFGRGYMQVGMFHILLDGLSLAALIAIGTKLLNRGAGVLAALMYALYPYLIFQNLTVIDTPLFMALMFSFLWCMALLREQRSVPLAVLAGVILAAGALTRPVMVFVAPIVGLWLLFRLPFWESVRRLLPVAVMSGLCIVPWQLFTYQTYRAFVPVANNGGMNFWFGSNPYTIPLLRAGFHPQWVRPNEPVRTYDTRLANDDLYQIAFNYLRTNPQQIPELLWVKFLAYWSIDVYPSRNPIPGATPILDYQGQVRFKMDDGNEIDLSGLPEDDPVAAYSSTLFDVIGRTVHRFYFGTLFVLALIGLVLTARRWRDVSLLWLVQLVMTAFYVIYIPATRYRVPTDPFLFLFSATALLALWQFLIVRRTAR